MLYTELNRYDELDRTSLVDGDAYKKYFHYMKLVFERVLSTYHLDAEGKQDEVSLLQFFLGRLLNSINCLGMKNLFEVDFKFKIDQSDSSYPNAYEFQLLQDDINRQRDKLTELKPKEILLRELIQSIYADKDDLGTIQHQLALRTYYENIASAESFFLPFTMGQLSQLSGDGKLNKYMYTYGVYEDTLSIPMLFQLIFETTNDYRSKGGKASFDKFLSDIKYASRNLNQLIDVVSYLDKRCDNINPKEIKRMVLGPLYGKYSTSDTAIGNFIHNFDDSEIFALEVQSELLVANAEPKSRGGKLLQDFVISKTPETLIRQVTDYRAMLFTPHEVGQQLLSKPELQQEMRRLTLVSLKN